jgi:hypothetical protein
MPLCARARCRPGTDPWRISHGRSREVVRNGHMIPRVASGPVKTAEVAGQSERSQIRTGGGTQNRRKAGPKLRFPSLADRSERRAHVGRGRLTNHIHGVIRQGDTTKVGERVIRAFRARLASGSPESKNAPRIDRTLAKLSTQLEAMPYQAQVNRAVRRHSPVLRLCETASSVGWEGANSRSTPVNPRRISDHRTLGHRQEWSGYEASYGWTRSLLRARPRVRTQLEGVEE